MQSVRKVLLDLQSDRTLGYKTQCSFGAIIKSLTAFNNNQPLNQLSTTSFNMSLSTNNQYVLARGLTITCPTVTRPLHNHRGNGPYTTPEEVCGSSMVVSPWLTFALDCQNYSGNCHREVSNDFPTSMVLDDQISNMSVVAQHCLETRRDILTSDRVDDNARVLFHLLNCGLLDQEVMDRLRDGTTRAMRYSTAMGEQLWRLIDRNVAQVGGLEAYSFDE